MKCWEATAATNRMGLTQSQRKCLFLYVQPAAQGKRPNSNTKDYPDKSNSHKAQRRPIVCSWLIEKQNHTPSVD